MDEEERLKNMGRNLNVLCQSYNSVADVCRRMEINRQQFNKYLAGKHIPSRRAMAKICQFFSIDVDDIYKSPQKFDMIMEGPRLDISWQMRSSDAFARFTPVLKSSENDFKGYYGLYYRYQNSSLKTGKILRSVFYLYERNGIAQYVSIERFPRMDGSGALECVFKYHGFALMVGDRIYLHDYETIEGKEMTFSILFPKSHNILKTLTGLVSGICANPLREPYSARVALSYQGSGPIRKEHLKLSGTLDPNSGEIPDDISHYLSKT